MDYIPIIIGVIVGISQYIKTYCLPFKIKNIIIDSKFIPIFNVIMAFGLVLVFVQGLNTIDYILQSIVCGLSASGLYSGAKNIKEKIMSISSLNQK